MSDLEFVTALCTCVVNTAADYGFTYASAYARRYANELADCWGYLGYQLFSDTPATAWYMRDGWIASALSRSIMAGAKDASGNLTGHFRPEDALSRAETATVLYRIANPNATDTTIASDYAASTGQFADVESQRYYTAAVEWCAEHGVVTGYLDGSNEFRPSQCVSRQELAVMVYRFARYMNASVTVTSSSAYSSMFGTDEVASWAEEAMRWCAFAGIITGVNRGGSLYCDPTGTATRAMGAKIFSVIHDLVGA